MHYYIRVVYTVYCIVYSVYYVRCTVYTCKCIMNIEHCTMYIYNHGYFLYFTCVFQTQYKYTWVSAIQGRIIANLNKEIPVRV